MREFPRTPPSDMKIGAVAVDPRHAGTVFVAGVGKTIDGGSTWGPLDVSGRATAMAVAPLDPSVLVALVDGSLLASADAGSTFSSITPVSGSVSAFALDPSSTDRLLAGAEGHVYRSRDRGQTWMEDAGGLPADGPVIALAVDAAHVAVVYAATGSSGANLESAGVFRSLDGGATWARRDFGIPRTAAALGSPPEIFPVLTALAADPRVPGRIYAGTSQFGVFRSDSGGGRWTPSHRGPAPARVNSLAIDPASPGTLYTADANVAFCSTDSGASWVPIVETFQHGAWEIVADPLSPSILYAIAWHDVSLGIFRSDDAGSRWYSIDDGVARGTTLRSLIVHPTEPRTLRVCIEGTSLGGSGVQTSRDGGQSWLPLEPLPARCRSLAAADATGAVYAATLGDGVFRRTPGAPIWAPATEGITDGSLNDVAVDPQDASRLYAAGGAVFTSEDAGDTWGPVAPLPDGVLSLAVNPLTSAVYAGYVGGRVAVLEGASVHRRRLRRRCLPVAPRRRRRRRDVRCGGRRPTLPRPAPPSLYPTGWGRAHRGDGAPPSRLGGPRFRDRVRRHGDGCAWIAPRGRLASGGMRPQRASHPLPAPERGDQAPPRLARRPSEARAPEREPPRRDERATRGARPGHARALALALM